MTTILTRCPSTGHEVYLTPADVVIVPNEPAIPRYRFACDCGRTHARPAPWHVRAMLESSGVRVAVPHPEPPPAGGSADDLLDALLELGVS